MNPSGKDKGYYKKNKGDVIIYSGGSSYYKALAEFTEACLEGSHDFSELDLFGIVQGSQNVVKKDFMDNPDYYKEMFGLFLKYVAKAQPNVVIVANAFVREVLLGKNTLPFKNPKYAPFYDVNYTWKKNEQHGGYTFTIGEFTCQIYFSSMLSGQHALDKGSRENLAWLVKNYINHL